MTGLRRLGMVAAGSTLLAAAPIASIFDGWTWLMQCLLAIGVIAGAAVAARTLRFPHWAQALAMIVGLLLTLTWMFPSGHEFLIPTPATFTHFADLFRQAGEDTRSYAVPVPDRDGLLFVTVLGIGAVAIAVDLLTVVLRRPALAGLPMLAIYSVPVAIYVDSVPVLPFIIGATGFLWLLVSDNVDRVRRFGRRFTGDGRDVDVWEPSPLAAAGRRLGVVGVIAAVLLPLLVPTITGGLLSQLTQSGSGVGGTGGGKGGGGGRINLYASLSGQLSQSKTVDLLKVTTNEPEPFYLRFAIADQLGPAGFASKPPAGNSVDRGLPDLRTNGPVGAEYQQYHAQVEITDNLRQGMLPVYSGTYQTSELGGGWSYDPNQQVIYSNGSTTKGKKYSFDYVRARFTPAQLRTAEELPRTDQLRAANTIHPPDALVDSTVDTLTKGKTTEYDKVRALYDYFSRDHGFTYAFSTQSSGNASDIDAFLKNKSGYCQQYSAALAWMVRAAGIPARVAFGFTRGNDRDGDAYVLNNRNAHAWTEVYFQNFGWVPFDATPAASVTGSTRSAWAPDADRPAPTTTASSAAGAPGTDPSAAANSPARNDPGLRDPGSIGSAADLPATATSYRALWIALGLALLLALLLVPALRRMLLRRHRHAATTPKPLDVAAGPPGTDRDMVVTTETVQARADAHAAWAELLDTMTDFRVPVDPAETPRVTAQRLIRDALLLDEPAAAATLLGTAEERARYARLPMRGGELTAALHQVRKGLSRSATRRTRLIALFLPPSILLRWRSAIAEGSARTVGLAGRMRDFTVRFSPRRLLTHRSR
jgi:transglutaminase-like putative cysteine protease